MRGWTSNCAPQATSLTRAFVRCLLVSLCALITLVSETTAQDASPKTFYKRDYASAPGAAGREYDSPKGTSKGGSGVGGSAGKNVGGDTSKARSSEKKKRRVVVSLFVNSAEKEHFQKVMDEVLSLHDSRRVFVTTVQHIGDYQTITPQLKEELAKRNIMLLAVSEPPSDANVTMSPTWIINTKEGTHIAEGIMTLTPFLNEYGEYDPKLKKNSTDLSKVEGF